MALKPANVFNLNPVLAKAEERHYAVGSFSPRSTAMILPILKAAQALQSPVIVQISQKELTRHQIIPSQFTEAFYRCIREENITVPSVLHLDHTREISPIQEAITAGFTSVMIDASEKQIEENIAVTCEVVEIAHSAGVSVEAELGRITTTDYVETDSDKEMYTDPQEAGYFTEQTGIDALAVSIGTAHGVYTVRQPKIDYKRLSAIRDQIGNGIHLVLHGGSGVPSEMVQAAIQLPKGGVSKINIATDLEIAALNALERDGHLTDAEMNALPPELLKKAQTAVEQVVRDKMQNFVKSSGMAAASST